MITPDEARKLRDDHALVDTRARFDSALRSAAIQGRWPCTISLLVLGDRRSVDLVADEYRRAGWNVGVVFDPREGDFVQVEAP